MLDRFGFDNDLQELRAEGDNCKIEFYLNQQFMELKDADPNEQKCCCYGYFQGGEETTKKSAELISFMFLKSSKNIMLNTSRSLFPLYVP